MVTHYEALVAVCPDWNRKAVRPPTRVFLTEGLTAAMRLANFLHSSLGRLYRQGLTQGM